MTRPAHQRCALGWGHRSLEGLHPLCWQWSCGCLSQQGLPWSLERQERGCLQPLWLPAPQKALRVGSGLRPCRGHGPVISGRSDPSPPRQALMVRRAPPTGPPSCPCGHHVSVSSQARAVMGRASDRGCHCPRPGLWCPLCDPHRGAAEFPQAGALGARPLWLLQVLATSGLCARQAGRVGQPLGACAGVGEGVPLGSGRPLGPGASPCAVFEGPCWAWWLGKALAQTCLWGFLAQLWCTPCWLPLCSARPTRAGWRGGAVCSACTWACLWDRNLARLVAYVGTLPGPARRPLALSDPALTTSGLQTGCFTRRADCSPSVCCPCSGRTQDRALRFWGGQEGAGDQEAAAGPWRGADCSRRGL